MIENYILDKEGHPLPEPDILKWAAWCHYHPNERIVKKTMVGEFTVSTIFLSVDHNFLHTRDGLPILWETMVFDKNKNSIEEWDEGDDFELFRRYTSKEAALKGHDEIVKKLEGNL